MEDKVLSERDTDRIVTILKTSSTIITNMDVLCGALKLTIGECEEISIRVQMDRAGPYKYLSLVLNKWIEKNSAEATVMKLAMILKKVEFNATADELLKTLLESQPTTNNQNNKTKNVATIVEESVNVEPSQLQVSQSVKSTKTKETTGISDQLEQVKLEDSQSGQFSGSEDFRTLRGSQTQLNEFLRMHSEKFNTLKCIEFENIEIPWSDFWYSVEHIKTLESIELTNLCIIGFNFPLRRKLLPNMREYEVSLDMNTSQDIMRTLNEGRDTPTNPGKMKYLVEALIPFAKNNLDEEVWVTCSNLSRIEIIILFNSSTQVLFATDKVHLYSFVDRTYVEYYQNSNSAQSSTLPNFLQTFQGLKKLSLTNFCGVVGYLDFSSLPTTLTHLELTDVPSSIRGGDFDIALNSCKDLIYFSMSVPKFDNSKHRIDIVNLSPKIRYVSLVNVDIKCSSHCEFNHLSFLYLIDSHYDSSVKVSPMFKNIKKCYFQALSKLDNPLSRLLKKSLLQTSSGFINSPLTELKQWLEMDTLELIVIHGLQYDKNRGVRGILSTYGVPRNTESVALQKNIRGQWKFVSLSRESVVETFTKFLKEAWWNDTGN